MTELAATAAAAQKQPLIEIAENVNIGIFRILSFVVARILVVRAGPNSAGGAQQMVLTEWRDEFAAFTWSLFESFKLVLTFFHHNRRSSENTVIVSAILHQPFVLNASV